MMGWRPVASLVSERTKFRVWLKLNGEGEGGGDGLLGGKGWGLVDKGGGGGELIAERLDLGGLGAGLGGGFFPAWDWEMSPSARTMRRDLIYLLEEDIMRDIDGHR